MRRAMRRSSRLHVQGARGDRPPLRATLRAWRERSSRGIDEVRALGYDERFVRIWATTWRSARRLPRAHRCATSRWCSPGPAGRSVQADFRPCWTLPSRRSSPPSWQRCRRSGSASSGRTSAALRLLLATGCPRPSRSTPCAGWASPTRRSCARASRRRRRSATTWPPTWTRRVRLHRTSGMSGSGMNLGYTARDAAITAASARAACAPPACFPPTASCTASTTRCGRAASRTT